MAFLFRSERIRILVLYDRLRAILSYTLNHFITFLDYDTKNLENINYLLSQTTLRMHQVFNSYSKFHVWSITNCLLRLC